MKMSISKRYCLYMLGFMLFCLVLNFSADLIHDAYEGHLSTPKDLAREIEEFEFVLLLNLFMLPLVVLIAALFVYRMLAPVRNITHTARAISSGHIDMRIQTENRDDELGELAAELNNAFDQYDEVLQQQQRFNSNAAHQLRTPLASLRTTGEVILQRPREPEAYQACVEEMLEQTVGLSRLVEQMLELSRLEQAGAKMEFEDVDLAALIRHTAENFQPVFEEQKLQLELDVPDRLLIQGNSTLLEQLLVNLLDNARKHTPLRGRIRVSLSQPSTDSLCVEVDDSGPGIPLEERSKIFERFDQGAHPDSGGHGLGLSIVQEICRVHQGSVQLVDSALGGACFRMLCSTVRKESP